MVLFINFVGTLLIATAVGSGFALGSWLFGQIGGLLGFGAGAAWGFRLAADCVKLLKDHQVSNTSALRGGRLTVLSSSTHSTLSGSKPSWLRRLRKERRAGGSNATPMGRLDLEEIHGSLKTTNSRIWKELRTGTLSRCHALLYTVQLEEGGESLDWRGVNRSLISCLNRFERATTDKERHASLVEALDRIGQKLHIVKQVSALKADTPAREEREEVERNEAELWRLSGLLRSFSLNTGDH